MELRNRRWSEEEFFERRKEVLAGWPTGEEVDLDEAVEFHRRLPEEKVVARRLAQARKEGRIILLLSCGQATVEETLAHMQFVEKHGGEAIAVMADAYTRKGRFREAQSGIEASTKAGRSMLNGYPWVNHGVRRSRLLVENAGNISAGCWGFTDEEPMLAAEIGLASGATMNGSHDLHDLLQHSKNYPLAGRIQNNQYTNRLAAYYTEHGAPVQVHIPVNLCGWFCPSLGVSLAVLCALLTAEQGVKHLCYGPALQCHLVQDVATAQVMRKLVQEYLDRSGYRDLTLSFIPSSWYGAWPREEHRGIALNAWLAAITAFQGADMVQTKSIEEAIGVTTKEGNARTIEVMKQVYSVLKGQTVPESEDLKEERRMIEMESRSIVEKVLELGDGDAAIGEVEAVKRGVLDAPFTPWTHAARKVLSVRDRTGAMRYLDCGNLPFSKEIIRFHRQKVDERQKAEGKKSGIEMLVEDVVSMAKPLIGD
ncbi:MAG: methylaspartate mutase subunit E [Chloroflexi bacterium]|nr:methylaspartate mutase subunit E [Chloroflexota bacterium]